MLIYQTRREVQPNGNIHYLDWLEEAEPPAELQEGAAKLRRAITEPEPAQYGMLEIKKYSEDQARDESGKWTSDGGAAQNYPRAGKTVELRERDKVIGRIVPVALPKTRKIPDFAAMRREIYGDRILPGADLLIEERERSRY